MLPMKRKNKDQRIKELTKIIMNTFMYGLNSKTNVANVANLAPNQKDSPYRRL